MLTFKPSLLLTSFVVIVAAIAAVLLFRFAPQLLWVLIGAVGAIGILFVDPRRANQESRNHDEEPGPSKGASGEPK